MDGKILSASANIYQDQAKVLFDYYRQAAEKIVTEEEHYEKEIAICKENNTRLGQDLSKAIMTRNICFAIFFLLIPIYFAITALLQAKKLRLEISTNEQKIAEFEKAHAEIFRDYKVSKLGVAYVPVAAQIPFEDKSFIIDYTNSVSSQNFNLHTLKQSELFTKAVTDLDALMEEAPIVEKSLETESVDTEDYSLSIQNVTYHDYLGKIDRTLRTSSFCLSNLDLTSVSLPVVLPESDYARFINEHSTTETGNSPVLNIFDSSPYKDEIDRFHSLNEMKKSLEKHQVQFEQVLRTLMMTMANSVQALTQMKMSSTNLIVDTSNKTLFKILKSSYNHYSPHLEADEIERIRNEKFNYQESVESYQPFQLKPSSKLRYDVVSDCWVAEDGSKTNFPFGVHQIHEEIVAPIVQNLMQETRIERMKIYNNIKDQKIDYLNQWHRDTEDFYARNRAESNDLINIMRSTLSEYISSYNAMMALRKTEENLEKNSSIDASLVKSDENDEEVFLAFEAKSKDFKNIQEEFMDYMDRLKDDIDKRAEKFEFIEYYDASLRDSTFKDYAVASGRVHGLDTRRMPLVAVNPFFAETTELPPPPSIEDMAHEHMSINLPRIARVALNELDGKETSEVDEFDRASLERYDSTTNNDSQSTESEGEVQAEAQQSIGDPPPISDQPDTDVADDRDSSKSDDTSASSDDEPKDA